MLVGYFYISDCFKAQVCRFWDIQSLLALHIPENYTCHLLAMDKTSRAPSSLKGAVVLQAFWPESLPSCWMMLKHIQCMYWITSTSYTKHGNTFSRPQDPQQISPYSRHAIYSKDSCLCVFCPLGFAMWQKQLLTIQLKVYLFKLYSCLNYLSNNN